MVKILHQEHKADEINIISDGHEHNLGEALAANVIEVLRLKPEPRQHVPAIPKAKPLLPQPANLPHKLHVPVQLAESVG
jgi:hypothetical protein